LSGKSHDSQADFPVGKSQLLDFGERVTVDVDDIVQEMDGIPDDFLEMYVVDGAVPAHVCKIDGSKVARFIREKRLFPAGIGALDPADIGGGIVPVDRIQKDDPRFSVLPGRLDDLIENLPGG